MQPTEIYRHFQTARDQKILLSFMGIVTQQIMVEYGKIINEQESLSQNSRLVLFSVFVEMTQNILRYSSDQLPPPPDGARGVGIVIVTESIDCFQVSSGNHVAPEQAKNLRAILDELVEMDADQLKQIHKQRRREGPPSGSLGAGLGLIEIVRRASQKPQFAILETDEKELFFSFSVAINKA